MNQDLSKLDPKLKEAYDRVMGTSITPPQSPKKESETSSSHAVKANHPAMATVNPPPSHESNESSATVHKAIAKKKGGLSPLVFALLGLVFFIAYFLIWIKVFNLKFPFVNP